MNQIDLAGQTAVITGGAQGIGFAIARRLIASGANVSLWDMNAGVLDKAKTRHRLSIHKNKGHMRITEDVIRETRDFIEEIGKASAAPD